MNNRGHALAWIVAAVAVVLCGITLVWGIKGREYAAQLETEALQSEEQVAELSALTEAQTQKLAALDEHVAQMEQSLAAAAAAPAGKSGAEPPAAPIEDEAATKAQAPDMSKFMEMYKGEQGRKMAKASASMAVNMYYDDLFQALAMPPEIEDQARDLFSEMLTDQIQMAAGAFGEDADPEAIKQRSDEAKANMRAELAKLLSDEGMAMYDEYEAALPEKVLRKSYDMQLNMFATGLTPENRQLAIDTLVEESLARQTGNNPFTPPTQNMESIQSQLDAMDRARERLAEMMEPDQIASFDRFLQQQKSAIEAFTNMMKPGAPSAPSAPEAPAAP